MSARRHPIRFVIAALAFAFACVSAARGQSLPSVPPQGSGSPAAADSLTSLYDDLIVEIHAGPYARETVFAKTDGVSVFLPVEDTLRLLGIQHELLPSGDLRGTLLPSGVDLWMSVDSGSALRGSFATHGTGFTMDWIAYAESEWVARWLGIRAQTNAFELTVRLEPVDGFPIAQRVLRTRARRMAFQPDAPGAAALLLQPDPDWLEGFVLDWGARTPGLLRAEEGSYLLGAGSALWGGALDVSWSANAQRRESRVDGSWHGVWPDGGWLRQLEVGQTRTTSPRGSSLNGFALGNAPYTRSSRFGAQTIRGQLPPDWEVDVYQYGRLVAFDRVDATGMFEFELPLDYGQNPVEIRAYGPNGEERILERASRVDFDRLPGGTFEYGISGGDCRSGDCQSAWNLDLRQGLSARWTVRGGVEHFERGRMASLTHPYASISGGLGKGLQLRLASALDAQHEVRVGYEPSVRLRGEVGFLRYEDSVPNPIWQPANQKSRFEASLLTRPLRPWRALFLTGDLRVDDGLFAETWRTELGVRNNLWGTRLQLRWRESWQPEQPFPTDRSELLAGLSTVLRKDALGELGPLMLRIDGRMDIGVGIQDEMGISVARRIANGPRLEMGTRWYRQSDDFLWTIALSSTGSIANWSTTASKWDGGSMAYSSAEGSLIYNESTERFEADAIGGRGRAGLQGTVFVDRDGNGIRGPNEPGLSGVTVRAGHAAAVTDDYGRYAIWQLLPFEQMEFAVDTSTISNPNLVPQFERATTYAFPNGFATLDVPLLAGSEVSGQIWIEDGTGKWPGSRLRVRLQGEERGLNYEGRTFSDGELYLTGVAPDRYRVVLDETVLQRAGLQPTQPEQILEVTADAADRGPIHFEIRLVPVPQD